MDLREQYKGMTVAQEMKSLKKAINGVQGALKEEYELDRHTSFLNYIRPVKKVYPKTPIDHAFDAHLKDMLGDALPPEVRKMIEDDMINKTVPESTMLMLTGTELIQVLSFVKNLYVKRYERLSEGVTQDSIEL
mgnify:CR=1 FL=1